MEITGEIRQICDDLLARYKTAITNNGHTASGNLASTASYKVEVSGQYIELIFVLQDYWKYLENGTKPHFPPIDAIEKWIIAKPIIPRAISGRVPSTRQLAFLIARGISEHGTKSTKLLQNTIYNSNDLIDKMVDEITKQLEKEIEKEIDKEDI